MPKSVAPYSKRLLILGVVLIVAGLSIFILSPFLFSKETVMQSSVDTTTTNWYNFDKFRAESGYWIEIDLATSGASALHVIGQTTGEIFKVEGTTYKYTVCITQGDVYQVQVENKAGHWYWFSWISEENYYLGNFRLERTPTFFLLLMPIGLSLAVVGSISVAGALLLEVRARHKARVVYACPSCGKEVGLNMKNCPYCKIDLTKYWIRCKYCKKLYDSHYEKCPRCGAEN